MRSSFLGLIYPCLATIAALPAAAQTMSPDAYRALYLELKGVEEAMFDSGAYPMWPNAAQSSEGFDLIHCGSAEFVVDAFDDSLEAGLRSIAHWVIYWRRSLGSIGYPDEIWQPIVAKLEEDALAELPAAVAREPDNADYGYVIANYEWLPQLVDALNAYRLHGAPELPETVADGACGDGEVYVKYELVPKEGSLYVLSEFRFHHCRAKGLEPFDRVACDRWHLADSSELLFIAGQYRYLVEWSDRSTSQGLLPRITSDRVEGPPIVIRKPDG
jgi:hypothetical protein